MFARLSALTPLVWALFPGGVAAQETAPAEAKAAPPAKIDYSGVESALESLAKAKGMPTAILGFEIRNLGQPNTLGLSRNADKSLTPASTLKLVTSGTALQLLGPDFQFTTRLQHDGTVDSETKTLTGNLYIRGGGDPTLAEYGWDKVFANWVQPIKDAGIETIEGAVLGDATFFPSQIIGPNWEWADIGNYYAPAVSGLSFFRNKFQLHFRPGRTVGSPVQFIRAEPPVPDVKFFSEVTTGAAGSGDNAYVYGAPYGTSYIIRGTLPAERKYYTIKAAHPDPSLFCARQFSNYLKKQGIKVSGDPSTLRRERQAGKKVSAPDQRTQIHIYQSLPLKKLLVEINNWSLNLHTECVLRAMGSRKTPGSSAKAAIKDVKSYLSSKKIGLDGFYMVDGCGLGRSNTMTPNQLVNILTHFSTAEHFDAFKATIPVAGVSGTLRRVGRGTAAEKRVIAKSGTLERIKCYAGYVDARSGQKYVFALMVNNYGGDYAPVKSGIVRVMSAMANL